MKTILKIFAVLMIFQLGTWVVPQKAAAQPGVSMQVFYDQLSPYGSWVSYPNYGYVWMPSAGAGFSPYSTNGHWVFTNYGWTWVSDYPWGWAPFHYGRWYFDPIYGWIWVPDTVWAPAWVVWRSSPGYFGWAPLRPNVNINIAIGSGFYVPNDWWVFVPGQYIASPNVYQYYVPRSNNVTIVNKTTIINKTYVDNDRHTTYIYGPDKDYVQKNAGVTVRPVTLQDRDKPGEKLSNGTLNIYRPVVQKSKGGADAPKPAKVESLKDMKPLNKGTQAKDATPSRAKPDVKQVDKNATPQAPQQRNPKDVEQNPKKTQPQPAEKQIKEQPPKSVAPVKQAQPQGEKMKEEQRKEAPPKLEPLPQAHQEQAGPQENFQGDQHGKQESPQKEVPRNEKQEKNKPR